MVISKQHAPHFTIFDECDFGDLVKLRGSLKDPAAAMGVKLTYLPLLVKAAVASLKAHRILNSSYDESSEEIVYKNYYNIGVAVATEDGLVVPVLKDADQKSLVEIAAEVERLAKGARDKKLAPADYQGGTFTITNIGSIGGMFATPIINYPEVAIMGINKIIEKPVVKNGQVVVRPMSFINVTCDHRLVDGATAAEFLNTMMKYVSQPHLLMLEMA